MLSVFTGATSGYFTGLRRFSLYSLLLAPFAMLSSLLAALVDASALAAMSERLTPQDTGGAARFAPPPPEEAVQAISGSPWPGVIDHLLQRPLPDEPARPVSVHINYPSLGLPAVDRDIRAWVAEIADTFEEYLTPLESLPETPDMAIDRFLQDDDLNSEHALKLVPEENEFELWASYSVSRPSDAAASITYEIWNYTPGNQGNLDILTLNYNLLNGQRLGLVDIFEKPDVALKLMSDWSRKHLDEKLGATRREKMLLAGTEPLPENFSSLTLTPAGIQINFQPFQVAPWDAGIQKVEMPLEELLQSGPLLALWGK